MKIGLIQAPTLYFTALVSACNNNASVCVIVLSVSPYFLSISSNLPPLFLLTPPQTHTHALLFICSVSLSCAVSHSFLPLTSVNLNPVLHQYISLWSWVEKLPEADKHCYTNQRLLPDSGSKKIKGSFLPLCICISLSLCSSVEIGSLFVPAALVWLYVKGGILSSSHGSYKSWLKRAEVTNECTGLNFCRVEGLQAFL